MPILACAGRGATLAAREPRRDGLRSCRAACARRSACSSTAWSSTRAPTTPCGRDALVFDRPLAQEGKLGFWRWLSMLLGIAGTYRKHETVDVQYTVNGKPMVATGLKPEPEAGAGRELRARRGLHGEQRCRRCRRRRRSRVEDPHWRRPQIERVPSSASRARRHRPQVNTAAVPPSVVSAVAAHGTATARTRDTAAGLRPAAALRRSVIRTRALTAARPCSRQRRLARAHRSEPESMPTSASSTGVPVAPTSTSSHMPSDLAERG